MLMEVTWNGGPVFTPIEFSEAMPFIMWDNAFVQEYFQALIY